MLASLTLFFVIPLLSEAVQPGYSKFQVKVVEGNAKYHQTVETQFLTNTVSYHVPAHNDIDETYTVQDFNRHLELKCFPKHQECFIGHLDANLYPDAATLTSNFAKAWKAGLHEINSPQENHTYTGFYKTKLYDLKSIHLIPEMQDLIDRFGYPVFEVAELPVGALFLADVPDRIKKNFGGSSATPHRRAIQPTFPEVCSDGTKVQHRFGYTSKDACDHIFFCRDGQSPSQCKTEHNHRTGFYSCFCCGQETIRGTVKLSDGRFLKHGPNECMMCMYY